MSDKAAGVCAAAMPTSSIGRPAVTGAKATVPPGAASVAPVAKATRSVVSDRVRPVGTAVAPVSVRGIVTPAVGAASTVRSAKSPPVVMNVSSPPTKFVALVNAAACAVPVNKGVSTAPPVPCVIGPVLVRRTPPASFCSTPVTAIAEAPVKAKPAAV